MNRQSSPTFCFSVPSELADALEKYTKEKNILKSAFIREAIAEKLKSANALPDGTRTTLERGAPSQGRFRQKDAAEREKALREWAQVLVEKRAERRTSAEDVLAAIATNKSLRKQFLDLLGSVATSGGGAPA